MKVRKTFKETWDYIRRNYLRKPIVIYIVFTLTGIILFFLSIFLSRYEHKRQLLSAEFFPRSSFNLIYSLGILFNTAWFIITGIIIIFKSIWDIDSILMKILGILFGIILIISSLFIVGVIYLILNIIVMR